MFSFVEFGEVLIKFSLDRVINMDELYEEYCQIKKNYKHDFRKRKF